jgi:hypothetical protein
LEINQHPDATRTEIKTGVGLKNWPIDSTVIFRFDRFEPAIQIHSINDSCP